MSDEVIRKAAPQLSRCMRCNGRGWLPVAEPECNGGRIAEPCERCGGKGNHHAAVLLEVANA